MKDQRVKMTEENSRSKIYLVTIQDYKGITERNENTG
jgi:hypothetical protein